MITLLPPNNQTQSSTHLWGPGVEAFMAQACSMAPLTDSAAVFLPQRAWGPRSCSAFWTTWEGGALYGTKMLLAFKKMQKNGYVLMVLCFQ